MSPMASRRTEQSGQAVVEFALTMFLFIACVFLFLGTMLTMETATEVNAATTLAASAAIQYPIGEHAQSLLAATKTFDASLAVYGIHGESLSCSGGNLSGAPSTSPVRCTGTARLALDSTPLGVLWRGPLGLLTFTATGQADYSTYRNCAPASTDQCP